MIRNQIANPECSCSYNHLDSHGLSKEVQDKICFMLNSFDVEELGDTHKRKVEYALALSGQEQAYAFHWIRFQ